MTDHDYLAPLLPFYAAGTLSPASDRERLEAHLAACADCRADLALWQAVAGAAASAPQPAPPDAPLRKAQARIAAGRTRSPAGTLRRAFELVRSQAPLIRREIWPSVAVIAFLGVGLTLVAGRPQVLNFLAPLAAAVTLSLIGGPENDPAWELIRSAAVSPGRTLLARLTLVYGFNLVLSAAAILVLRSAAPAIPVPPIIGAWLAPMTFLSAAGLILSLRIGTANAVTAVSIGWLIRFLPKSTAESAPAALGTLLDAYRSFWASPAVLFPLAIVLTAAACRIADRLEGGARRPFGTAG